jgi:hypothetical protein
VTVLTAGAACAPSSVPPGTLPALVWAERASPLGFVTGRVELDGVDPARPDVPPLPAIAAPEDPSGVDAWLAATPAVTIAGATGLPRWAPWPPLGGILATRLGAQGAATVFVPAPAPPPLALHAVPGDLVVDTAGHGAGFLAVAGRLTSRPTLILVGSWRSVVGSASRAARRSESPAACGSAPADSASRARSPSGTIVRPPTASTRSSGCRASAVAGLVDDQVPRVLIIDGNPTTCDSCRRRSRSAGSRSTSRATASARSRRSSARGPTSCCSTWGANADGMEVLDSHPGEPPLASTPVVIFTTKAGDDDVVAGYKFGADYHHQTGDGAPSAPRHRPGPRA